MKPGAIHVHIDRLVVSGLPLSRGDGAVLSDAVSAELTRLLRTRGWAAADGGAAGSTPVTPLSVGPHTRPAFLGRQIAARVHAQIPSPTPPTGGATPFTPRTV